MYNVSHSKQEIMVIDRSTLFADGYFQGFAPANEIDYEQIILDNYFYKNRDEVETKSQFKQPIAYCIIVNKSTNDIFAYQRSVKEGDYSEKRLRGKWSWGIGGHIDKIDVQNGNPIEASMLREIEEEVDIHHFDKPKILGYINDDSTDVGQVHFGLLFLIKTDSTKVTLKGSEAAWGGFMPFKRVKEISEEGDKAVETWSQIGLSPLMRVLGLEIED